MKQRYTSDEMREMALVEESYGWDVVAKMLRQAADAMEREKKLEYAWAYDRDGVKNNIGQPKEYIERIVKCCPKCKMFRRSVGEWEHVEEVNE